MSAIQSRPKGTGSEQRFHAAAKRIYAGRVRFSWKGDAKPDSPFGPGRWIMEEYGRESCTWKYTWTVEGPNGEPRRLGSWIHGQIVAMDRYAFGLNPRATWNKLSMSMDSGRLLRARRLAGDFEEAKESMRDKAAHRFGDKLIVPMNPDAVLSKRSSQRTSKAMNENAWRAGAVE